MDSKGQHQPEVSMPHDANSSPSFPPSLSSAGRKLQGRMQSGKPTASWKWGLTGAATASLATPNGTVPCLLSRRVFRVYVQDDGLSSSIQHAIGTVRDDTEYSMPMGNA
ncbi:hypothetical protein FVEG_08124 [Fusarium verticillioides 7600]|uniref:Uncharacterized protein n=1 Tax=Gibberella moniliformis (strain M3125 / FGSC 7600) TaxID=334819 RepID=W7ML75_GIBM7|nr:hypothetical protein FVEG_08124 [Fusarium verticillioides 7600]EWG48305.1 hypothetical protein FVEG_08124 [Fusarium verticillioides 7600]